MTDTVVLAPSLEGNRVFFFLIYGRSFFLNKTWYSGVNIFVISHFNLGPL